MLTEFQCRWKDPHGNWRRNHCLLDITAKRGEMISLPPPMFTLNAAWDWRLEFWNDRQLALVDANRCIVGQRGQQWNVSETWTQINFTPWSYDANIPSHGLWWLRYRTPGAGDYLPKLLESLTTIINTSQEPATVETALTARREIIHHMLRN